ncbi:hypothetical protein NS506_02218 [Nocardia seriolae]|uniref:DUF4333 domain-containing protein n=1 Tax=Nocardia seriolae TaxID=37332 RepID=A0ABC9Z2D7_9NOCA|nr:DUF1905 domain-containing protein [Nocardia seriolae]APA96284.1 hypothetical protein NS506_02218 [Nocardia seriolae]OJF82399.1 hypothetical protein NS14008_28710 [Nocardia seriolae]GAM49696.1 hypothetical protein NS07_v2contig00119-0013 [Nocardia seriolae]GAP31710.1 hypothetical protein NSK11_contig00124-0012 [Nocardia seriolae]
MRGPEVQSEVVEALGARPPLTVTINGHCWKNRVALVCGCHPIGLGHADRQAADVEIGEAIEVEVELDTAPPIVVEPAASPPP